MRNLRIEINDNHYQKDFSVKEDTNFIFLIQKNIDTKIRFDVYKNVNIKVKVLRRGFMRIILIMTYVHLRLSIIILENQILS